VFVLAAKRVRRLCQSQPGEVAAQSVRSTRQRRSEQGFFRWIADNGCGAKPEVGVARVRTAFGPRLRIARPRSQPGPAKAGHYRNTES
jgi:hypothetical protein